MADASNNGHPNAEFTQQLSSALGKFERRSRPAISGQRAEIAAAVLVPIYFDKQGTIQVVFTERRPDLRTHAGEISFPGGRSEPNEEPTETALREAHEELGLHPSKVEIVGPLDTTSTYVSEFIIHPFVGIIEPGINWIPAEAEVANIFEFSVPSLREGYGHRYILDSRLKIKMRSYQIGENIIWGATARILEQLLVHLKSIRY